MRKQSRTHTLAYTYEYTRTHTLHTLAHRHAFKG